MGKTLACVVTVERLHPDNITPRRDGVWVFGSNLAGSQDEQIAPLFAGAPANCSMPDAWSAMVGPAV